MGRMHKPERPIDDFDSQKKLTDYNRSLSSFLSEEQREKQRNKALAKWHLEESFRLFLESLSKNSIELELVLAYVYRILRQLEKKEMCYFKRMKDGKFRVFKKYYCRLSVEEWRKCPEFRCPVGYEADECPHFKDAQLPPSERIDTKTVQA